MSTSSDPRPRDHAPRRSRWAAIGAAVTVSLGGGGLLTTSASVGSGERPTFVPIAPCRLFDTRPAPDNVGSRSTPLTPGDVHVATVIGTNGNCTIPGDAVGVVMNVAIVNPSAASFLTVYPPDAARPLAANLNWIARQDPTPNAVVADLSADGRVAFYNLAGTVDIAADINGYFVDHNHDDRYYTKAEVDARTQPQPSTEPSTVTLDTDGTTQYYLASALGADGSPVIAYYESTNSDLKVAKCANPRCTGVPTITTVVASGNVGQEMSMTIGTDGLPILAYFDFTLSAIRVAKCNDPACATPPTITTVRNGVTVSFLSSFTAITIAANGLPFVVLRNDGTSEIVAVQCTNQSCSQFTSTVVAGAQGQFDPALAIGSDGNPIFATGAYLSFDLIVNHCANPACTSVTAVAPDFADDVGHMNSLAIGRDGKPIISYFDNTNHDLKVAACSDLGCTSAQITTVDATGDVGRDPSIAIGADGNPVISYVDASSGRLKVATCANAQCSGISATTTNGQATGTIGPTSLVLGADGLPIVAFFANGGAADVLVTKCGHLFCG